MRFLFYKLLGSACIGPCGSLYFDDSTWRNAFTSFNITNFPDSYKCIYISLLNNSETRRATNDSEWHYFSALKILPDSLQNVHLTENAAMSDRVILVEYNTRTLFFSILISRGEKKM